METIPPPNQLEFFLIMVLNYIVKAHVSYDKAFKTIVKRYNLPKWSLRIFYKIGYYTVNYYYTLRWLAAKNGYGVKPAGIVAYFSRIGFSIRRAQAIIREETKQLSTSMRLSLIYSYPEFIVKDLLKHMPPREVEKILMKLNEKKRWLRINLLKTSIEEAHACLEEENILFKPIDYPEYMLFVEHPKWEPIGRTKCVSEGLVVPQDIASAYVVEAIRPEKSLLDACSAPGLKLSLAYMLNDKLSSIAVDASSKRILIEQKLLDRLGVPTQRVLLINSDSSSISFNKVFDYAIVDAPCSGLGAVYSDPAVKINTSRRSKLEHYHEVQYKILKNTLKYAEKVVYSTCSIHPMEGEEVIKRIIEEDLAEPVKINLPRLATGYRGYSFSKKVYRTQPHVINGQGFFIAVLESKVVNM